VSDIAIRVEDVRKRYRIVAGPQTRQGTKTLRDALTWRFARLAGAVRARVLPGAAPSDELPVSDFWALDGVSFTVQRGEVIGLIGRNGAGKSTLLKILSRIVEPTAGRVELHGRVGSLLEVGTGFHQELSGRENIYLNGAVLGMKRAEIARKFDEIVAFSEVERFLDTPVKRYSSGMYVRLAFAVAAHLEPEILLVDEVLAVGDAAFQKKCLGKMNEVARGGRTVIFVSHNLSTIEKLCPHTLLLDKGKLVMSGVTDRVVQTYSSCRLTELEWVRDTPSHEVAYLTRLCLVDEDGVPLQTVTSASTVHVVIEFTIRERNPALQLSINLLDHSDSDILGSAMQELGLTMPTEPGHYRAVVQLPPQCLLPKMYSIQSCLYLKQQRGLDRSMISFLVEERHSLYNVLGEGRPGLIVLKCDWTIDRLRGTESSQ